MPESATSRFCVLTRRAFVARRESQIQVKPRKRFRSYCINRHIHMPMDEAMPNVSEPTPSSLGSKLSSQPHQRLESSRRRSVILSVSNRNPDSSLATKSNLNMYYPTPLAIDKAQPVAWSDTLVIYYYNYSSLLLGNHNRGDQRCYIHPNELASPSLSARTYALIDIDSLSMKYLGHMEWHHQPMSPIL